MTAAHCAYVTSAGNTRIIAGDHNLASTTDTNWAASYLVAGFIVHPSYSDVTGQNDVALARTVDSNYIRFK